MSSKNFILLHTRTKSYSIKESGKESVNNDITNENENDTYFDNYDHFLNVEMKVDEIGDMTSNTYKRPNLVTDDDVIEKHETMDSPYGKKKTVQHETDVLGPVHFIRPPSKTPFNTPFKTSFMTSFKTSLKTSLKTSFKTSFIL